MLLTADDLARMLGLHPVYVRDVVSLKKPRPEGRGEGRFRPEETPCGEEKTPATAPPPGELPHFNTSRMYVCAPCSRA